MQARFEIEVGKTEVKEVKETSEASIYLCIQINGVPVVLPQSTIIEHDGLKLLIGRKWSDQALKHCLYMSGFGQTVYSAGTDSNNLCQMEPKLPALFKKLSDKLCNVSGLVDLNTGLPVQLSQTAPQIIYRFTEPVCTAQQVSDQQPSRIFFSCTAIVDKAVVGKAEKLTVEYTTVNSTGFNNGGNVFRFAKMGWIKSEVDDMRQAFSDAVIEAAFQDLAKNMMEIDCTPATAATWNSRAVTRLELTAK